MPLQILVSNPSLREGEGGRDDHLIPLLRGLAARGHQLVLSCDEAAGAPSIPGCAVHARGAPPPPPGRLWRLGQLFVLFHLVRALRHFRRTQVNVVLTSGVLDVCAAHLALRRTPIIYIPNSLRAADDAASYLTVPAFDRALIRMIAASLQWYAMTRADAVIAFTTEAVRFWRRDLHVCLGQAVVTPPGIDTDKFSPREPAERLLLADLDVPTDAHVLLAVSRLVPLKDVGFAIRALSHPRVPSNSFLLLAGDGSERPRLEQLAGDLGVAARVRFLGSRLDVDRLLRVADVFLHPSRLEYFGLAVAQALASGLPVVVRRSHPPEVINAFDEIVEDGATGYKVSSAEEMGACVAALLADPGRRAEIGRRARLFAVREYSWPRHVDAVEAAACRAAGRLRTSAHQETHGSS